MMKVINFFKNIFLFQQPQKAKEQFILKESNEGTDKKSNQQPTIKKANNKNELKKPVKVEEQYKINEQNPTQLTKVSSNIDENLAYLTHQYSIPLNTDVVIRKFDISLAKNTYKAFIISIDGITDTKLINEHILEPLMSCILLKKQSTNNIITYIERNLVTQNQLKINDNYQEILRAINYGECALFVEGADKALIFDVKSWEHRTVDKPNTEMNIRGPQEGFGETLRTNTALIRKNLQNENLIIENLIIGQRSRTSCSIIYLKDLANPELVNEVRTRVDSLNIDYATDSGIIEQLIEDNSFIQSPQIISTERPDRVASMLAEGRVAILIDGNPFALVVPCTLFTLFQSSEDSYLRFPFVNLLRFIRYLGIFSALLLPGIYVAITTFHHEMIPTDLLIAISASREMVPFPTVVEILVMEISFELIREAGIRMPGTIGPTLGIIGALILGQAAVAANIVSPILIIVVAVTGLGSLAIPNFSLGLAFRLGRFAYIFLGAVAGLLGITLGLFVQGCILSSAKSFGVPFLAPFAPKTSETWTDTITRAPLWKQEKRPDYLNPQDTIKQTKISRGWTNRKNKRGN